MARLGIFLPTYRRPGSLQGVATNIEQTTKNDFKLYFGLEPDDLESIEAAKATGHEVVINKYSPGFSNTVQTIYEQSDEPFFFYANDDFLFLPNWDEVPLSMFDTDWVQVVGAKQTENDRTMSAISFVRRKYIEEQSGVIDMPNRVLYPYHHNYTDTEMTQTAQHRGVWAACDSPCIIHQHPGFTGAEKDATYRKNDETSPIDAETFNGRKHLWESL